MNGGPTLLAIEIGNTRTHIGVFKGGELASSEHFPNDDVAAMAEYALAKWNEIAGESQAAIAVASVNDGLAERLSSLLGDQLPVEVWRVGTDLPIPVGRQLDPETITGDDRLLNAAAAYDLEKQACIVVDAGTAVTVDFIDGEGTFHGGAIAPGGRLQLKALHAYTDALPELPFARPDCETFGRSTGQAMLNGVFHGLRGMVWKIVERYAERYGAYPKVIATGGDAELLFADDELVDTIVPHLTLVGIMVTVRYALAAEVEDD